MLKIRAAQMQAFSSMEPVALRRFLRAHVATHFPPLAALHGPEGLEGIIDAGLATALDEGCETRTSIALFVDLRILLGSGFLSDPLLPWVEERRAIVDPSERVRALYTRAMLHLDLTLGRDAVLPAAPLRAFRACSRDELASCTADTLGPTLDQALRALWPQKHRTIAGAPFARYLRDGRRDALAYGLGAPSHTAYLLVLRFLLGHRCEADPQYPWLGALCADGDDPEVRVQRTHRNAQVILGRVFAGEGAQ